MCTVFLRIVIFSAFLVLVVGRRCLPFNYPVNGAKCGDNTRVEGTYCGVGKCNIFGTSCQDGCRNVRNLKVLHKGDVIMCTKFGGWKGAVALNDTHVMYPVFKNGFTVAIRDLLAATVSDLGQFCRIETKLFDHYAHILGYAPRQDITTPYHQDVLSYNWEYQVTMWKYGVAFSPAELAKFLDINFIFYGRIESRHLRVRSSQVSINGTWRPQFDRHWRVTHITTQPVKFTTNNEWDPNLNQPNPK